MNLKINLKKYNLKKKKKAGCGGTHTGKPA